eukprot:scaffold34826_cov111-Phaeocystis_antarctica.AAC.1
MSTSASAPGGGIAMAVLQQASTTTTLFARILRCYSSAVPWKTVPSRRSTRLIEGSSATALGRSVGTRRGPGSHEGQEPGSFCADFFRFISHTPHTAKRRLSGDSPTGCAAPDTLPAGGALPPPG